MTRREAEKERTEIWQRRQNEIRIGRNYKQIRVNAMKARQEDWLKGPLAPRRDVGEKAKTYGAMSIYDVQLPEVDKKQQTKWCHLHIGDRVVVTTGRERGKIGEIQDIDRNSNGVRVKNMNVADVNLPKWLVQEDGGENTLQAVPRNFPMDHLRLVYPLPDPETGVPRDVVIERLESIGSQWDKLKKEWTDGNRVITGTNTIIPWPTEVEEEPETQDADTRAVEVVENPTFRPYLLAAPMPLSVIDELRGKYSKFRTKHEPEYVKRKEDEAERVRRREGLGKTMRTPQQEVAELKLRKKRMEERELTTEQLARIGEVIEREEKRKLAAAAA